MAASRDLRVLFAVAAGPRVGFGHLVRCRSLARALGVAPLVIVRGSTSTQRRATASGWRVMEVRTVEQLRRSEAQVVVVDDPSAAAARAWVRRARRAGVPVASIHDLGIAPVDSDLLVDGTVAPDRRARGRVATLTGPGYMILDPRLRDTHRPRAMAIPPQILIALGGGSHAHLATQIANAIARTLAARAINANIRITSGLIKGVGSHLKRTQLPRVQWIDARDGLAGELAAASVAIVAGGVTLYEACALGTPSIAVAVNAAQQVTIRGVARAGATVDAGRSGSAGVPAAIARQVERLLGDRADARRLAAAGRRLVDGRGAARVAAQVRQLAVSSAARVSTRVRPRAASSASHLARSPRVA